jgi:hypothetical protein
VKTRALITRVVRLSWQNLVLDGSINGRLDLESDRNLSVALDIRATRMCLAYDIWSLGCLYLEFLTWILKGSSAVEKFSIAQGLVNTSGIDCDEFYAICPMAKDSVKWKAIVKDSVKQWIADLKAHPRCSDAVAALLLLVETQLLRAEPAERSNIIQNVSSLNEIIERGRTDPRYLCKDERTVRSSNYLRQIPAGSRAHDVVSSPYDETKSPSHVEKEMIGRNTFETHPSDDSGIEAQSSSPSNSNAADYPRKYGDKLAAPLVDFQQLLPTQNKDITPTAVLDSPISAKRRLESAADDDTPNHDCKRAKRHATTTTLPVPALVPAKSCESDPRTISPINATSSTTKTPMVCQSLPRKRASSLPLEYLESFLKKAKFS